MIFELVPSPFSSKARWKSRAPYIIFGNGSKWPVFWNLSEGHVKIDSKWPLEKISSWLNIGGHALFLTLPIDLTSTGFDGDHFLVGDGLKLNSLFLFKLLSKSWRFETDDRGDSEFHELALESYFTKIVHIRPEWKWTVHLRPLNFNPYQITDTYTGVALALNFGLGTDDTPTGLTGVAGADGLGVGIGAAACWNIGPLSWRLICVVGAAGLNPVAGLL